MQRALQSEPAPHPRYVVWELTLACDLACAHCGSRAGKPRQAELDLAESIDVLDQLKAMGTHEITFIGGEAYLAPHWLEVIRGARDRGIHTTLTTGGRGFTPERARSAADAGLELVSVSIDGLRDAHDHLRRLRGSFDAAFRALDAGRDAGLKIATNTQINRRNLPDLEALGELLFAARIVGWQVQLTGAMGRAADLEDTLLQPFDLLELMPRLGALASRARELGCRIEAANNLGYYGPHEGDLRSAAFSGCHAGRYLMGIESNGDIKGCPSLPSAPYVGGNVRDQRLKKLWSKTPELRFSRDRGLDELWGFCKGCYYAETCRGGCSWTSHTLLGRRGNMPYCHHRALELQRQGLRERLVRVERAPGQPFDFGRFELVLEPLEG